MNPINKGKDKMTKKKCPYKLTEKINTKWCNTNCNKKDKCMGYMVTKDKNNEKA